MNIVEFTSLSNKPIRMIEGEIIFQADDPALNIVLLKKAVDIITRDGNTRLRTYDTGPFWYSRGLSGKTGLQWQFFVGSGVFAYSR